MKQNFFIALIIISSIVCSPIIAQIEQNSITDVAKQPTLTEMINNLPNVTVTTDGKVLLNGKEVQQILIDGKQIYEKADGITAGIIAASPASKLDVVKKLPNATVTADGKVLLNGKEVQQVLVDGEKVYEKANGVTAASPASKLDIVNKVSNATVTADGKVLLNGEEVKQILIDGKQIYAKP